MDLVELDMFDFYVNLGIDSYNLFLTPLIVELR